MSSFFTSVWREAPWRQRIGLLPVLAATLVSALLYGFYSLKTPYFLNDWDWVESTSSLDRFITATRTFESVRIVSRLVIGLSYRFAESQPWVASLVTLPWNALGAVMGYRLYRALGFTPRVAFLTCVAAFFAASNLEGFSFHAGAETAMGRTVVLAIVLAGLDERGRRVRAPLLVLLGGLTHETVVVSLPLLALALWYRDGWEQAVRALRQGPMLLAAWLLVSLLLVHHKLFVSVAMTHRLEFAAVMTNLRYAAEQMGVEIAAAALAGLAAQGSRAARWRPVLFSMLWGLVAYLPYLPMAGYQTRYFVGLAAWGLTVPLAMLADQLLARAGRTAWAALPAGLLVTGLLFRSVPSAFPRSDEPDRLQVAVLEAAQRALEAEPGQMERRFWAVGTVDPGGRVSSHLGPIGAILSVDGPDQAIALLEIKMPRIQFRYAEADIAGGLPSGLRRGEALLRVECDSDRIVCSYRAERVP